MGKKKIITFTTFLAVLLVLMLTYFLLFKGESGSVNESKKSYNKENYVITLNSSYIRESKEILNKLNDNSIPESVKEVKEILNSNQIKEKYKPVLVTLSYYEKEMKKELNSGKPFYCYEFFNKLETTNAWIITIYGQITSNNMYKFKGNVTKLIIDMKKDLANIRTNNTVIKWVQECKLK